MIAALMLAGLVVVLPPEIDSVATPGVDNPAVAQDNIRQTICVHGWTATVRPPVSYTDKLKAEQIKALGWSLDPKQAEENHRVPLEVGGDPKDPKNLSPEPYTGDWNARVRDKLETATSHAICAGRITLEQGRAMMKQDWIPLFKRYCGPTPQAKCLVTGAN